MLDRVAVACARKRGAVILIVALVSLFMAYGVINLKQTSDYKKFLSPEEASVRVTMSGGFLVLSLSRMPAMSRFGELVALVIFYAFIAAILFLPSALGARRKSNPTRS